MKKILVVMTMVISAGAFANGYNGEGRNSENRRCNRDHSKGRGAMSTKQLEVMTPEQQEEFKALHKEHKDAMKLVGLDMKEIDLQIQKEMLAEKPNQSNINKLIDKKSNLQADKQKEALSFKLEMKEKFDLDIRGNNGHSNKQKGRMISKANQKNHKSRG